MIATAWSWPSSTASRVCSMNAATSRADEHLARHRPRHQRGRAPGGHDRARLVGIGENQREVALEAAQHGQHRRRTKSPAVVTAPILPATTKCTAHLAVGVAEEFHAGRPRARARNAAKFSMIPLCTTAIFTAASLCGCALRSVGRP